MNSPRYSKNSRLSSYLLLPAAAAYPDIPMPEGCVYRSHAISYLHPDNDGPDTEISIFPHSVPDFPEDYLHPVPPLCCHDGKSVHTTKSSYLRPIDNTCVLTPLPLLVPVLPENHFVASLLPLPLPHNRKNHESVLSWRLYR